MEKEELNKRATELFKEGKMKLICERRVTDARGDVEGLREIIRANEKICTITIDPINPPWLDFAGCDEKFFGCEEDEGFRKAARDFILKI